jgi:chromosome segregation ATPase
MAKKDTGHKPKGWLKGILSTQGEFEQSGNKTLNESASHQSNSNQSESNNPSSHKNVFSKDNQDKVSLDLIVSIENMLNDRQLLLYKSNGLEGQLNSALETINRQKQDLAKKEQQLQDKTKEISTLETSLTNKQMSYDQLLEDLKDHQQTSSQEFEKISNQLEKEHHKYKKLREESISSDHQHLLKIKELEERIRNLEVENQKHMEQCQKITTEKNELMKTINDFTERMSFSFAPKSNSSTAKSE